MCKQYDDEDIEEMIELINEYKIEYDGCERIDCQNCGFLEDCYYTAKDKENSEWAKSINYGGYSNEEEFWEQLMN